MTDIADLIRDAYEVAGAAPPHHPRGGLGLLPVPCAHTGSVSARPLVSLQKFGGQSVEQIERMRCRHRIRVLQGHEETTKQNVVSGSLRMAACGWQVLICCVPVGLSHDSASFLPRPVAWLVGASGTPKKVAVRAQT